MCASEKEYSGVEYPRPITIFKCLNASDAVAGMSVVSAHVQIDIGQQRHYVVVPLGGVTTAATIRRKCRK